MKFFALIWVLFISALVSAQGEPTATPAAPDAPDEAGGEADEMSRAVLEGPFLQDDLTLLIGNVQRPNALVWFDEHLYTICNGDWTIYRIDVETGDTITYVFGVKDSSSFVAESTAAGFDFWIPDSESGTLWQVNQDRLAPVDVKTGLERPWGITRAGGDRFLITSTSTHSILEVSERGVTNTVLSGLRSPTGITRDGGRVYFANGGSARRGIEWFELQGDGSYSEPQPLVTGLQNTTNLIMGGDGFLYFGFALGTRGVVGRVAPQDCLDGGCGNADVEMVVFSDVPAPITLTLSEDMRLFMHSRYRPEIYWVQLPV